MFDELFIGDLVHWFDGYGLEYSSDSFGIIIDVIDSFDIMCEEINVPKNKLYQVLWLYPKMVKSECVYDRRKLYKVS